MMRTKEGKYGSLNDRGNLQRKQIQRDVRSCKGDPALWPYESAEDEQTAIELAYVKHTILMLREMEKNGDTVVSFGL